MTFTFTRVLVYKICMQAPPPSPSTPQEQLPDPRRWWALCVLGLAQLMILLDSTIVNVALPSMQTELGMADGDRPWVVTSYTVAFGGLLLLAGRIADHAGRKRVFASGLLGFAVASAAAGAAPTTQALFAARAVQGAFAALLAASALALVATTFTDLRERRKAIAVFGALGGAGASSESSSAGCSHSGSAGAGACWSTCPSPSSHCSARCGLRAIAPSASPAVSTSQVRCSGAAA